MKASYSRTTVCFTLAGGSERYKSQPDERVVSEPEPGMATGNTYAGPRVLELTTTIAGPFSAMTLADLGVAVVKGAAGSR